MERCHLSPSTSKHDNYTADHLFHRIVEPPHARYEFENVEYACTSRSQENSSVEDEFRRIQSRHHRTLAELNLSFEHWLMPLTQETDVGPTEDPGFLVISTRSSTLYDKGVMNGSTHGAQTPKVNRFCLEEDPGRNVTHKNGKVVVNGVTSTNRGGFWIGKRWRKFLGFSSDTSVNKADISNGKCNQLFS